MSAHKCPQCRGELTFVSQGADSKWVCSQCRREFTRTLPAVASAKPAAVKVRPKKKKPPLEPGLKAHYRWWEYVAAFLGIPIDIESRPAHPVKPLVCLTVALLLLVIGYAGFLSELDLEAWGLVPARALQKGGLTFLTSIFLHVDSWHLLPNVYFLVVFGEKVEQAIGHKRFLLLLLLSALFGNVLHVILESRSGLPLVGMSGGVAGVMLYYALSFPRQRLGIIFLFQWVRVPAHLYVAFWLLYQIMGAVEQLQSLSPISYMAHLGGGMAGYFFWKLWRKTPIAADLPATNAL